MALDLARVRALVFDVDGTLADTDDHLVQRIATVFDAVPGVNGRTANDLARRLVMEAETPVNAAYGWLDRLGLDDDLTRVKNAVSSARDRLETLRAERQAPDQTRHDEAADEVPHEMMAGVKEMIPRLAERFPMSAVSTGGAARVEAFLTHYGVREHFAAVVTAQSTPRMKPHPDPIEYAASVMDVDPEAVLVIGDTTVDMESARSAGAQAVGVLCGFGMEPELVETGAQHILDTTADAGALLLPNEEW